MSEELEEASRRRRLPVTEDGLDRMGAGAPRTKFMKPGKMPTCVGESPQRLRVKAKSMIPTEPKDKSNYTTALRVEGMIGDGTFARVFSTILVQKEGQKARKAKQLVPTDEQPIIYLDSNEFKPLRDIELGNF